MQAEFSVVYRDFLWTYQVLEVGKDEHTLKFVDDLRQMLDTADKVNLGLDARLELWTMIDAGHAIGPVLYSTDSAGALLLHQSTLCSLLAALGKVLTTRYAFCLKSFVEYRCQLKKDIECNAEGAVDNYKKIEKEIEGAEVKLREEALSFTLFKLNISYEVYNRSLIHYM